MAVTILDILGRFPNIATEYQADILNSENPYITIITEVPVGLAIQNDFDVNGKILISAPFNDVVRNYGSTTIDELCDLSKNNFKVCWSPTALTENEEGAVFKLALTLRIISYDVDTGTVNFTALRNKYGSSTIVLTQQIEK